MVNQSDYHNWDVPEVDGDEDKWGDYLRNTLADGAAKDEFDRALDDEVVLKDTIGNRPVPEVDGRWFLATLRKTLYYDNGSSWEEIVGQHMPNSDIHLNGLTVDAWNHIDVVEAGVDNTGNSDVRADLDSLAADNTLLIFPEGTYRFDGGWSYTGYDNFGMVGKGDVTFKANYTGSENLIHIGSTTTTAVGLYFGDITLDFTATDCSGTLLLRAADQMLVENVDIVGEMDSTSATAVLRPEVHDAEGAGIVRNVRLTDGGVSGTNFTGILTHDHVGKLRFEDCQVAGFDDNGLYDSANQGQVVVDGGVYKNNGVSQVRFQSDNSIIRDATISVTDTTLANSPRGIRISKGNYAEVSNCDIHYGAGVGGNGPLTVNSDHNGPVYVRNTQITYEDDTDWYLTPADTAGSGTDAFVVLENCEIEYEPGYDAANSNPYGVQFRNFHVVVRDTSITPLSGTPTDERNGVRIINDAQATFDNAKVEALQTGIVPEVGPVEVIDTDSSIDIKSTASDVTIRGGLNTTVVADAGTRTVIDGMGENVGDPNSTGQWNGNDRQGVVVENTDNGDLFTAAASGGWTGNVPKSGGTYTGSVAFNAGLTVGGDISAGTSTIYDATNDWVPEAILENNTVTIAGNSVSLGNSTTPTLDDFAAAIDANDVLFGSDDDFSWWFDGAGTSPADELILTADPTSTAPLDVLRLTKTGDLDVISGTLSEGGTSVALTSRFPLPNSDLSNSSVTVAGNAVSLGASTAIAHADLSSIAAEQHHSQIQVSDSGVAVMTQPTDVNFGSNLDVTDDTDGTVTVDSPGVGPYSSGDYVLVATDAAGDSNNVTTSSSTYTEVHTGSSEGLGIDWSSIQLPTGADGNFYLQFTVTFYEGGDQIYWRAYDTDNAAALVGTEMNKTTGSWDTWYSPIVQYNDQGSGSTRFTAQIKNGDGATTVYVNENRALNIYTKMA